MNSATLTTIIPFEEKYSDIEQCNKTLSEVKSILKPIKTQQDIVNDTNFRINIIKIIAIIFVAVIISPFVICDLLFGYTDDSCVNIYPENLIFVNMKTYLLVSGYYIIGLISIILINLYFSSNEYGGLNIMLMSILTIVTHISKVFLIIWNIIGAVIFWGTLYKFNNCSKSINTYLFISLIVKLLMNFYNVMSSNKKQEK